MIARPCAEPGCPGIATHHSRCQPHARAQERRRGTAAQRGYGPGHRVWRLHVLARDPVCKMCNAAPSTVADHKLPLRQGGTWALSNGQGLCGHCHNVKRATTDKGRGYMPGANIPIANRHDRALPVQESNCTETKQEIGVE